MCTFYRGRRKTFSRPYVSSIQTTLEMTNSFEVVMSKNKTATPLRSFEGHALTLKKLVLKARSHGEMQ